MNLLTSLSRTARPSIALLGRNKLLFQYPQKTKFLYPKVSFSSTSNLKKVSPINSRVSHDVFMQGTAASYIEEMYDAWMKDPRSVHLSWQVYFRNMENGVSPGIAYQPPPTIVPLTGMSTSVSTADTIDVYDHMKVQLLVRAYQVRGHHIAELDPLGINNADLDASIPKELDPVHYGFTEKDLDRKFSLGPGILPAFGIGETKTLREIIEICRRIYSK